MPEFTSDFTVADAMAELLTELRAIREDIKKLDRRVDDFRSTYDHHAAQESRVHTEIRQDIRSFRAEVAGQLGEVGGLVKAMNTDLTRMDGRVELLDGLVH